MSELQLIRQPLAVRFIVAPVLRLALAVSLLLCLLGFWILSVYRQLTGQGEAVVVAQKHPTRKRPMHMGNAMAALKLAQKLADECGAKPFLISGTLLGIHRNGALLAHDNDLDLGIFADDPALSALVESLRAAPQVVRLTENRLGAVGRIANPSIPKLHDDVILYKINVQCMPDARPVRLDLFVHFNANGAVAHGSTRTLWVNSPFRLSKLKLEGTDFWAPADCTRYLSENYGDFSVPKVKFESSVDCPNCANILTFPACAMLAKKWVMFRQVMDEPRLLLMRARLKHFLSACVQLAIKAPLHAVNRT